jgi:hypothetical protein
VPIPSLRRFRQCRAVGPRLARALIWNARRSAAPASSARLPHDRASASRPRAGVSSRPLDREATAPVSLQQSQRTSRSRPLGATTSSRSGRAADSCFRLAKQQRPPGRPPCLPGRRRTGRDQAARRAKAEAARAPKICSPSDDIRHCGRAVDRQCCSARMRASVARSPPPLGTTALPREQARWSSSSRVSSWNARSHANRRGHRCPSAPAMQHSGAAEGQASSTVSHGSRRLQAEERQCPRRRRDCRCWCTGAIQSSARRRAPTT